MKLVWVGRVALGLVGVVLLLQVVPYGREHTNPPVTGEPQWPPGAHALAERACFDCHSNETKWPWYSSIAPVSWLVFRDTMEGRRQLNFSEWDKPQREAREAANEVREGEMPMALYLPLHHDAVLSAAERQVLIDALETIGRTAGSTPR
ncbi:MAG: heme-binding domain-containing protein [Myxococcaceae bacterium]|jgi:hypothetical protein|nr:heme-binding domain-containing protein [Myxococcaceae bacterium]